MNSSPQFLVSDTLVLARKGFALRMATTEGRSQLGSVLAGVGFALMTFAGDNFGSYPMYFGWLFVGFGLLIAPSRRISRLSSILLVVLLASAWIAIPFSVFRGNWFVTAILAVWLTPFAFLWLRTLSLDGLMVALVPAAILQSVVMIWQGLGDKVFRSAGLVESPNPAGAFMALVALYLLSTRARLLAVPLLIALALSGSRTATGVFVVVIVLMISAKAIPFRQTVLVLTIAAVLVIPWRHQVLTNYSRGGADVLGQAELRLTRVGSVSVTPNGFQGNEVDTAFRPFAGPTHNVLMRVAMEWGILAAAAWAALTVRALLKGWRIRPMHWYLLVAAVGMGVLDYYVHIGALAWVWWVVLGLTLQETTNQSPGGSAQIA